MITNSQLSKTKPKKTPQNKTKLRELEQEQNDRNGDHMEGYLMRILASRILCCGSNRQIHTDYRNPVEKKGWHGHSLSERG